MFYELTHRAVTWKWPSRVFWFCFRHYPGAMELRVSVQSLIQQLVHEQAKATVNLEVSTVSCHVTCTYICIRNWTGAPTGQLMIQLVGLIGLIAFSVAVLSNVVGAIRLSCTLQLIVSILHLAAILVIRCSLSTEKGCCGCHYGLKWLARLRMT